MADSGAIARLRDERAVTFTQLPNELIEMILVAAGTDFQFPLSMVCRRWYVVLREWRRRKNIIFRTPFSMPLSITPMLRWSINNGLSHAVDVCGLAASSGNLELLQALRKNGYAFREGIVYSQAAGNGHLHIMNWAYENQYKLTAGTLESAAKNRQMAVLAWLVARNCPYDEEALYYAACSGNLEVLQFVLRWFNNNGLSPAVDIGELAARSGNLEILQWARANGTPWGITWILHAAEHGHLEIIKWAHAMGCPWQAMVCDLAASNGHLETLQWARANGCPWSHRTCSDAASNGHLEVLQWAFANGCPANSATCAFAAGSGHLEVLQWARANGIPWDSSTIIWAQQGGHHDIAVWARDNGCPEPP